MNALKFYRVDPETGTTSSFTVSDVKGFTLCSTGNFVIEVAKEGEESETRIIKNNQFAYVGGF